MTARDFNDRLADHLTTAYDDDVPRSLENRIGERVSRLRRRRTAGATAVAVAIVGMVVLVMSPISPFVPDQVRLGPPVDPEPLTEADPVPAETQTPDDDGVPVQGDWSVLSSGGYVVAGQEGLVIADEDGETVEHVLEAEAYRAPAVRPFSSNRQVYVAFQEPQGEPQFSVATISERGIATARTGDGELGDLTPVADGGPVWGPHGGHLAQLFTDADGALHLYTVDVPVEINADAEFGALQGAELDLDVDLEDDVRVVGWVGDRADSQPDSDGEEMDTTLLVTAEHEDGPPRIRAVGVTLTEDTTEVTGVEEPEWAAVGGVLDVAQFGVWSGWTVLREEDGQVRVDATFRAGEATVGSSGEVTDSTHEVVETVVDDEELRRISEDPSALRLAPDYVGLHLLRPDAEPGEPAGWRLGDHGELEELPVRGDMITRLPPIPGDIPAHQPWEQLQRPDQDDQHPEYPPAGAEQQDDVLAFVTTSSPGVMLRPADGDEVPIAGEPSAEGAVQNAQFADADVRPGTSATDPTTAYIEVATGGELSGMLSITAGTDGPTHAVDVATSQPFRHGSTVWSAPVWSPDGSHIAHLNGEAPDDVSLHVLRIVDDDALRAGAEDAIQPVGEPIELDLPATIPEHERRGVRVSGWHGDTLQLTVEQQGQPSELFEVPLSLSDTDLTVDEARGPLAVPDGRAVVAQAHELTTEGTWSVLEPEAGGAWTLVRSVGDEIGEEVVVREAGYVFRRFMPLDDEPGMGTAPQLASHPEGVFVNPGQGPGGHLFLVTANGGVTTWDVHADHISPAYDPSVYDEP